MHVATFESLCNYFEQYDLHRLEVLKRYLLPIEHPLQVKLKCLFDETMRGSKAGFIATLKKLERKDIENLSSDTFMSQDDDPIVLKMEDDNCGVWYLKCGRGSKKNFYSKVCQIYNLFRVVMSELVRNCIKAKGLENDIESIKEYIWHIPGQPELPDDDHYIVLSEGANVFSGEETLIKLKQLPLNRFHQLTKSLFTVCMDTAYFDPHSENIRLKKDSSKLVAIEAEPGYMDQILFYSLHRKKLVLDGFTLFQNELIEEDKQSEQAQCVQSILDQKQKELKQRSFKLLCIT